MLHTLHPSSVVPAGFIVHDIVSQEGRTTMVVRHGTEGGVCPSCDGAPLLPLSAPLVPNHPVSAA